MHRAASVCLALVVASVCLTGCWSRHELNELSIVAGLGIDKDGDDYKMSVQIVSPSQVFSKTGSTGNISPVVTYTEVGSTIPEAFRRMSEKIPRQLLFSHLRLIVISEETAKEGIGKPLDFLSRNAAMRTDFYLVIAKQTSAKSILEVVSRIDPIPSNNLFSMLQTSDKLWAAAGKVTLEKLLKVLGTPGKSPTLTGVEIIGQDGNEDKMTESQKIVPTTKMKFSGMAVFKEDRLVGWLGEQETKAVKYLQNTVKGTVGVLKCPNDDKEELTIDVYHVKSKIVATVVDDKPVFDINVRVEADIADIECKLDLTSPDILKQIKQEGDKKLENILTSSIRKVQDHLGADIFGLGDALHQAYPVFWRRFDDWNETFRTVEVRVHTDNIIRRIGTITQPVDSQTKP